MPSELFDGVRNKLADVLRAKALVEAQMNAHELGVRLQQLEWAIDEFQADLRAGICTVPGHPK